MNGTEMLPTTEWKGEFNCSRIEIESADAYGTYGARKCQYCQADDRSCVLEDMCEKELCIAPNATTPAYKNLTYGMYWGECDGVLTGGQCLVYCDIGYEAINPQVSNTIFVCCVTNEFTPDPSVEVVMCKKRICPQNRPLQSIGLVTIQQTYLNDATT